MTANVSRCVKAAIDVIQTVIQAACDFLFQEIKVPIAGRPTLSPDAQQVSVKNLAICIVAHLVYMTEDDFAAKNPS